MKKSIITSLCLLMLTAGLAWSQFERRGNSKNLDMSRYSENGNPLAETVVFSEGFNGINTPDSLALKGWIFINNDGGGTSTVFNLNPTYFTAYEGPTNGAAAQNYQGANGYLIDQWIVSPIISVTSSDTLSFFFRTETGSTWPDSIDVLISPTGGATVPDFTHSFGIRNVPQVWTEARHNIPYSGNIRIAVRYYIRDGGSSGTNSDYWALDLFRVFRGGTPPGAFHLLQPADDTRLVVHSTSVATIDAVWGKSVDPGTVTYTFVADSSASFGATKFQTPSNNTGADTVFTIPYQGLDEYLEDLGVARGDSLVIYWKAIASNGTLTTTSTETWSLNVVRDNYVPSAFDLIDPPNGFRAVVSALNTDPAELVWGSSIDPEGEVMTYTWMIDSSLDFGATTWVEYTGGDTTYETPVNTIDAYVAGLGVAPGDSITLYWAVIASDGFNNVNSTSIYEINIVRELLVNNPPTPANLLSPANGARIHVYPGVTGDLINIWSKSIDPDGDTVRYTVVADVVATFDSPDLSEQPSDNLGLDTTLTSPLSDIENWAESLGVGFGDSITIYWKILSSDDEFDINSNQVFTMNVVRTLPPPTIVFFDDFESGTTNWTLQGTWGLSTAQSHSPTHSLTESPGGLAGDDLNISATKAVNLDLSTALDATISFWARYQIEQGFDYMYLEASTNGTTWINLATFDSDVIVPWQKYTYSLGGFVGNNNVRIRFRYESDGAFAWDGMYIDDVEISVSNYDASAPLITHTGPVFYQATIDAKQVVAEIIDISGIDLAELKYTVDNGGAITVAPDSSNGTMYYFTIPGLPAGSWVKYWIEATDGSPDNNFSSTDEFEYISGNYIAYDNAAVNFVTNFETGTGGAVKIDAPTNYKGRLVTALIRNYTDNNRPNDSMIVHIWADAAGFPGTDLITPFKVKPEATLSNTSPMTRIDLRPYAVQLTDLTSFHIGFTVPDGAVDTVWITITQQPSSNGRASVFNGTSWAVPGTPTDYHFRAIMDTLKSTIDIGEDIAGNPNKYELYQNYPNPFNPTTTIKYDLKENAKVTLKIFNTLGQEVRTLVNSTENAGPHHIIWDGKDNAGNQVSSGLYIYRLQAGSFVKSHKMMFLK